MRSYCIHGAVKQHLCWVGICSSLPKQLWWQLHRAGCGLLFAPLPAGKGAWGSAPCTGVWASAGGGGRMCQGRRGVTRQLSLTSFCRALAAVVLLSDPDVRAEVPDQSRSQL